MVHFAIKHLPMHQNLIGAMIAGFVIASASCQRPGASRVYDVTGAVVGIDTATSTVEMDHAEIPGYMKAMRMKYPVADAKLLDGLKAGDSVTGKLRVDSRSFRLMTLEKR